MDTGDASPLLALKPKDRADAMKALSLYAKITGRYGAWKAIREAYGLRWSLEAEAVPSILSFKAYSSMLEVAKKIFSSLDMHRSIVEFIALSGLRVGEAFSSIKLYCKEGEGYVNKELMVLEHYRYPNIFLRRTKKAYITVLDDRMLETLDSCRPISYSLIHKILKRRLNSGCRLDYFRKIWATYMRLKGIDPEVIDLLQGRTPKSIFLKHYYRPDIKPLIENVRDKLRGLREELGIAT
ncbi:MAG: integrase [Nitrososphaerota archaeon]